MTRRKGILYKAHETTPICEARLLRGVPKCGVCFGVGLTTERHGVTLTKSWYDCQEIEPLVPCDYGGLKAASESSWDESSAGGVGRVTKAGRTRRW